MDENRLATEIDQVASLADKNTLAQTVECGGTPGSWILAGTIEICRLAQDVIFFPLVPSA